MLAAGEAEAGAQQIGPGALPAHPGEEGGIIVTAAADRADRRHHLARAIGIMRVEPGTEQRRHLQRQADGQEERAARTRRRGDGQDRFHFVIGDMRHDRGQRDIGGNAGVGERADRGEPAFGMGHARFQRARGAGIERGDRDHDRGEPVRRHRREQIDIANDPIRLGGDRQRMPGFGKHRDAGARDPPVALDRLIGIGIRPERDRPHRIARPAQFGAEQFGGIRLGEQARFEIQPGGEIEIRMAGTGKAIDAAMFAAPIGVDRTIEADVGRLVARDDGARRFRRDRRAGRWRRAVDHGAGVAPVAIGFALRQGEAGAGRVAGGTAAVDGVGGAH